MSANAIADHNPAQAVATACDVVAPGPTIGGWKQTRAPRMDNEVDLIKNTRSRRSSSSRIWPREATSAVNWFPRSSCSVRRCCRSAWPSTSLSRIGSRQPDAALLQAVADRLCFDMRRGRGQRFRVGPASCGPSPQSRYASPGRKSTSSSREVAIGDRDDPRGLEAAVEQSDLAGEPTSRRAHGFRQLL